MSEEWRVTVSTSDTDDAERIAQALTDASEQGEVSANRTDVFVYVSSHTDAEAIAQVVADEQRSHTDLRVAVHRWDDASEEWMAPGEASPNRDESERKKSGGTEPANESALGLVLEGLLGITPP